MAKESLKERLKKKQAELKSRSSSGNIVFLKDGQTIRARILPAGKEQEFVAEVTQFYLGGEIKGVISPATFGEPCALWDAYNELKNSKDPEEKEMSKSFNVRRRYLALCVIYKDDRGKEVDDSSPKFILLTGTQYQRILDLYMDDAEWGDMTQLDGNGYDIKFGRTGSGKMDTEYTVAPCKNTPCPKKYAKTIDIVEELHKIMPSFEETKELLDKFIGGSITDEEGGEDDDEDKPNKKPQGKKIRGKKIVKKPKKSDLE